MALRNTNGRPNWRLVLAVCAAGALVGCSDAQPPAHLRIAGGDGDRGRALIRSFGCGACHVVDGVRGARGNVGPSLTGYAQRKLLAGILPNAPRFLIPWLVDPVAIAPATGMPSLGLTEAQARDIATYLYTLGAARAEVYPTGQPLEVRGREDPNPMRTPSGAYKPRT